MKATDALVTDHRMIRKTLEGFNLENPRFGEIQKTLQRIVHAHDWFEEEILLPALKAEKLLDRLNQQILQEHQDLAVLFERVRLAAQAPSREQEGYVLQIRTILDTHIRKEEDALFPLAESILDSEGLNRLGDEMLRRKTESLRREMP